MVDELAIQREPRVAGRASAAAPPLSSTAPLFVWLLIQVGALAGAAFRLPLAAKYPQPAEMQAASVLLAAQIIGISLLFPFLCRTWNSTVAVAASAFPLLLASCGLAGQIDAFAPLALFVVLWVAGTGCWRAVLTRRWQHVLAALLTTYTAGGAILWYLRGEFVMNGQLPPLPHGFSPLLSAFTLAQGAPEVVCWASSLAFAAVGTAGVVLKHLHRRVIRQHTSLQNSSSID
jgi:hypothetical protein